jgi:homogentisate 1,2-dioxygenase
MMGAGSPGLKNGMTISRFNFNTNMDKTAMYSSDSDMLIVPQVGTLLVTTEMGRLTVGQKEIIVIPRGIKFSVDLDGKFCRGWICETFKGHFVIPDLGPIGSNGLANERDF